MKLRVIIVDDEPLARERIRFLLREEADVEIVAECENGKEAVEQIQEKRPDLVFLDVQMPEIDGFAVLQRIPAEKLPVVIFTTAFDKHAVRAFEAHALDYLLKPFKPARFKEAIQRVQQHIATRQPDKVARQLLEMLAERTAGPAAGGRLTRLTIKSDDRVLVVPVEDIDSIESAGNYVVVHVGKNEHILRDTLTALEARMPDRQFFRVSRGAIVNLDRVKELQPMFQGESVVVLKGGRTIPTTRSLREIQEKLESL